MPLKEQDNRIKGLYRAIKNMFIGDKGHDYETHRIWFRNRVPQTKLPGTLSFIAVILSFDFIFSWFYHLWGWRKLKANSWSQPRQSPFNLLTVEWSKISHLCHFDRSFFQSVSQSVIHLVSHSFIQSFVQSVSQSVNQSVIHSSPLLKLINNSWRYKPTRAPHSRQVDEFETQWNTSCKSLVFPHVFITSVSSRFHH